MKLPLSKLPLGLARFALAGLVALLWLLFTIGLMFYFIPWFQPGRFLLYYPAIWLLLTLGLWLSGIPLPRARHAMNPPADEGLSGNSPAVPPPRTKVTTTLRHALGGLGLLFLSFGISLALSLAVIWAVRRMLPMDEPGKWARENWIPLLIPGPALAAALMFWRQHRASGAIVVRPLFVLGVLLALPLAAMAGLLTAMALPTWLPLGWRTDDSGMLRGELTYLAVGGIVPGVLWWGWHNRWRKLAATAVFTGLLTVWLVWDEPAVSAPLDVDVLAPLPPRAAESHAVAVSSPAQQPALTTRFWWPKTGADSKANFGEWRLFVVVHRDSIRADWAASTAVRDTITRLDAFDDVGDMTSPYGKSPVMNVKQFRATVFLHYAYASLLAVEGRGDEAIEVLRPVLSVSRKLKRSARSFLRFLGGDNGQSMCQDAAWFVLQATTPSPDSLRPFAAVLAPGDDLAAAFQRVFLCECADLLRMLSEGTRETPLWERWLYRLFYNPNATANLATRRVREFLAVAMEGRSEGLRAHQQAAKSRLGTRAFKNAIGQWTVAEAVMDLFPTVVNRSRALEDQRRALLAEVQKRFAAAAAAKAVP